MRRPVCVLAAALLAAFGAAACTRSPASDFTVGRSPFPPSSAPVPSVVFTVSSFDVDAADPASVERVKAAVASTLDRYLEAAVLTPLRSGGPAGELGPLFTARAAEHLASTADRAAFVDEGLPPALRIVPLASGLSLSGLADRRGEVVLVAARMDLRLAAEAQEAIVTIDRAADLLLVPDGDAWKIDSYRVRVTRDTSDRSYAAAGR